MDQIGSFQDKYIMLLDKQKILELLSEHQDALKQKYPLKGIALFGSYARGEQHIESDIDLLVDFTQPIGIEIVDLAIELEGILGHSVDIITYNAIKNRLFDHIKDELNYA